MSADASLEVLAPGVLTTIQDSGRNGWRHLGIACCGALDPALAALANRLVGNAPDLAVLELSLHGPRLRLHAPARIAWLGAQVDARFEGWIVPPGRPVDLPAGRLDLGPLPGGARAWLAIAGGFDVPVVLGSRSTDLRGGFGGLNGRALRRGDRLAVGPHPRIVAKSPTATPWWIDPAFGEDDRAPIRYVPSDHATALQFAHNVWRVGTASNRQGLRLNGSPLSAEHAERISEPVAPGTVQLPPDGQPIVLLADAQTVGGYPRLGHVVAADLPRLAQCLPNAMLHFQPCTPHQARALADSARARQARLLLALRQRVG